MARPSFSELRARVSAEPPHREVPVPPIRYDPSPIGFLNRLDELMAAARDAGHLAGADFQQYAAAAQGLKAVLVRLDLPKLAAALRSNPKLGFPPVRSI